MAKLDESEDGDTTLYYILDADSSTANIANKLEATLNYGLGNSYRLYIGSQTVQKAPYEDGTLLVFKARFVKKESTKIESAVNTVSESEDESDTMANTEDFDGDIKDDTSKKPETEVENKEASESSEM